MIFFITAIGRSGTKFLSNLLNQCENTLVLHEPLISDRRRYNMFFNNPKKSTVYMRKVRKNVILINAQGVNNYGEVNGFLRRHILALRKTFPEAKFLHLVRDGRDVVRSIYSRKAFEKWDKSTVGVEPPGGWKTNNRFKKICWYWNVENVHINKHIDKHVNLEKIINDYDYFKENVLDFLGLELSKEVWNVMSKNKVNATRNGKYKLPIYDKWNDKQKRIFNKMCGKTMRKLGYII